MERLRQALRALSEAEKQLRVSSDKLTWLTAALLQLAPDQQYLLPSSSTDRSLNHSPVVLNNQSTREIYRDFTNKQGDMQLVHRNFSRGVRQGYDNDECANDAKQHMTVTDVNRQHGDQASHNIILSSEAIKKSDIYSPMKRDRDTQKIWRAVLDHIPTDTLKQFLYHEGNLISVSLGAGKIKPNFLYTK